MKYYKLPSLSTAPETVILANGKFPTDALPLYFLQNTPYLVCCDGAVNQLEKINLKPSAIVGDCDSMLPEYRAKYKDIIFRDTDEEINDLTKAVNFCINNGYTSLTILGATGKREDHTLGNISLLTEYIDNVIDIQMITDYGVFNPVKKTSVFESFTGQQISLFSFDNCPITTDNLKYPVTNRVFTNWWQGSLNESLGDEFAINISGKFIVYRAF